MRTRQEWEAVLARALAGRLGSSPNDLDGPALDRAVIESGGIAHSLISNRTFDRPKLHTEAVSIDVDTENGEETVQALLTHSGLVFLWPFSFPKSAK